MYNQILLGYRLNDIPLSVDRGYPFQLLAEDKWGYKWIRWVSEIEASRDHKFRGYWENRGYSQQGDLKSPPSGTPKVSRSKSAGRESAGNGNRRLLA